MSFGNSIHGYVKSIRSYEEAHNHFTTTKPRRSKYWRPHQRPLYEKKESASRMQHYRIEQRLDSNGAPYYDLMLYDTPLVRYLAPRSYGTREVWVRGNQTQSSWDWLRNHGWGGFSTVRHTESGKMVRVYFNPDASAMRDTFGDTWSAKLTLNAAGRLIVGRSRHVPVFARYSSYADRRRRANIKRNIATMLDLAVMRRDVYRDDISVRAYKGRPFTETSVSFTTIQALRHYGDDLALDGDMGVWPDALVNALMDVAGACYERLANNAAYEMTNNSYKHSVVSDETAQQVYASISDDKLRASVLRIIEDRVVGKGNGRRALPQFISNDIAVPKTLFFAPDEAFLYEDYFSEYPPFPR